MGAAILDVGLFEIGYHFHSFLLSPQKFIISKSFIKAYS